MEDLSFLSTRLFVQIRATISLHTPPLLPIPAHLRLEELTLLALVAPPVNAPACLLLLLHLRHEAHHGRRTRSTAIPAHMWSLLSGTLLAHGG